MTTDAPQISEREREILRLVAKGATNQQIAHELHISINTVKVHLRNIFGKIGATSRTEATVYAIRQGLVVVGEAQPGLVPLGDTNVEALAPVEQETALPTLVETPAPIDEPALLFEEPPVALDEPAQAPPVEPISLPSTPIEAAPIEVAPIQAVSEEAVAPAPARRFSPLLIAGALLVIAVAIGAGYFLRSTTGGTPATPTTTAAAAPRWETRAPLLQSRTEFAVTSYAGAIYVISGLRDGALDNGMLRYAIEENTWEPLANKPTPVRNAKAAAIGGRVFVPGGEDAQGKPLALGEVFDTRSGTWDRLPDLPAPRSRYALASVEGTLYLFGGWDGERYCDEVFALAPGAEAWAEQEALPTPRQNASAAVLNGAVYVIGGEDESGALRANERFQPFEGQGGTWDAAEPLPAPVATPAAIGLYTTLSVVDPELESIQFYTPSSEAWTTKSFADVPFSSAATGDGTNIFLFGPPDESNGSVPLNEIQGIYSTFFPGTLSN